MYQEEEIKINGFLLLIPVFLIRYMLLAKLNKSAMKRASHYPPMIGVEKVAFLVYQLSTVAIFVAVLFLEVQTNQALLFYTGIAVYIIGLILLSLATINFSTPSDNGVNQKGLYRLSRNPMYVAYFVCFMGISSLVQSVIFLGVVFLFQISAHWIILSEERWCIEQFGAKYLLYMNKIRRYI